MVKTREMRTGCRDIVSRFALCGWLSLMSAMGYAETSAPPTNAAAIQMEQATQYALDHKLNWGKAERAIIQGVQRDPKARRPEVDDTCWVFFKTPAEEEDLLWKRVLVVKRDGGILNLRGDNDQPDAFNPKRAKQLATDYARDHKLGWGEAEREVDRKDADTYWVSFKTPKEEEALLWKRVLVVKRDGTISGLPRR